MSRELVYEREGWSRIGVRCPPTMNELVTQRRVRRSTRGSGPRSGQLYRWLTLWLAAGALLALLLLANSFRDYRFVSRLLAAQQVHQQTNQVMVSLEQQLRTRWQPGDSRLHLLNELLGRAQLQPVWVTLRNQDGVVLEVQGAGHPVFTLPEEIEAFRNHVPLRRTITAAGQQVVAEAFPIFLPHPRGPVAPAEAATSGSPAGPPSRSILIVELATPLRFADPSVLAPQHWNLFVNSTGALALLGSVLIAGLLLRSYVRGRALEQQLEVAREVQAELLLPRGGAIGGLDIAAEYRPAEVVAGDFYDAFTPSHGGVALVMGDVSGKGIPAALLMGVLHGAVRSSDWTASPEAHRQDSARLNRLLCERAAAGRYASMFWAHYDAGRRQLRYVNGGHCPPLLVRRDASGTRIEPLDKGGTVFGLLPDAEYESAEAVLNPGDLLVLYSDGLVESTNPAGEEFGEERLQALLAETAACEPGEIRSIVLAALESFLAGARPTDDLTLLIARAEGAPRDLTPVAESDAVLSPA